MLSALAAALLLLPTASMAQLSGRPSAGRSQPLSEHSGTFSEVSRPVHERGKTLTETSAGPLSGQPARRDNEAAQRTGTFRELGEAQPDSPPDEDPNANAYPRFEVIHNPMSELAPLIQGLAAITPSAASQPVAVATPGG